MIVSDFGAAKDHLTLSTAVLSCGLFCVAFYLIDAIYSLFLGPLAKIPGPKSRALSYLPLSKGEWTGTNVQDALELHEQYGRVVRMGPKSVSFIGTPEIWKDIHGFRKAGAPEISKDPRFYGEPINKTPGLITADGPTHSRQRKVVSNAFSDKALKELEPMFKLYARKMKSLMSQRAKQGVGTDMVRIFNFTTFDIMADLTFAEPLHMLEQGEYVPWVSAIFGGVKNGTRIRAFKIFSDFNAWFFNELSFRVPAIRQKGLQHWRYVTDKVDRRLAKKPDRTDLWTIILERGGFPGEAGSLLSLEEHHSIASLFMLAGTETTATALSGTTYYLLKNPKYMADLKKELRGAFRSVEDMHLDSLARLPLLDAVLREGLRIYPPVPIGLARVAPRGGAVVGNIFIPEGTTLYVHQHATYRCEKNFKNANEFHPERWLGDPSYAGDNLAAVEPFSTGPRNCLGKNLAWHEMRLLLATAMLHFDFELDASAENWKHQQVFTLWEKSRLTCRLKELDPK